MAAMTTPIEFEVPVNTEQKCILVARWGSMVKPRPFADTRVIRGIILVDVQIILNEFELG